MDLIQYLSSENGTLEICSRIVHYLSKHFAIDYELNDIEHLIKMFVIFCESVPAYEDQRVQHANDESHWFFKNSLKIMYNEETSSTNFVDIAAHVLKTNNFIKNGIIVDIMLRYVKKYLNFNINLDEIPLTINNINSNRKKLNAIIERIFLLPCTDIENAIDTIIKNIGFEILGYVFCESSTSIYFDKCTIVSDFICDKIKNSAESVINFFMPSLFMVLKSASGKTLFEKCLRNKTFNSSLNYFLRNYFINFEKSIKSNESHNSSNLLYNHIFYIMYLKFNDANYSNFNIFEELNANQKNILQDYLTNVNIIFN